MSLGSQVAIATAYPVCVDRRPAASVRGPHLPRATATLKVVVDTSCVVVLVPVDMEHHVTLRWYAKDRSS